MPSPADRYLLNTAPQLNVHRWSKHPEINDVVDALFSEIEDLRKAKGIRTRGAKDVKKHLKVCVLDLWVANRLSLNPYRAYSRNKTDYRKLSRYRKIYLTYDYLIPVVNNLVALGYVEQKLGFKYHSGAMVGRRTRIKATDKLIGMIESPWHGFRAAIGKGGSGLAGAVEVVLTDPDTAAFIESETIILRNADKTEIDYADTRETRRMRVNLARINSKIDSTHLALKITNTQFKELEARMASKGSLDGRTVDFTNRRLHRVFNNASFKDGGRFYGGWWQELPREYRKYIEINHKNTVELDYSGHHIRMLYAITLETPPDDPYDLPEEQFSRDDQKQAILIILNSKDKDSALKAMGKSGIKKAKALAIAMERRHKSIEHEFYTGIGVKLQRKDSDVAEAIMLAMLKKGVAVLPVHDSFIVRASYEEQLTVVMERAFSDAFGKAAKIKPKKTVLEEARETDRGTGAKKLFVNPDISALGQDYKKAYEMFG